MFEQSYTRHLVLLFHNVWPTNLLSVPISVIIVSYWRIVNYVRRVSQMSVELPPGDRSSALEYGATLQGLVCLLHVYHIYLISLVILAQ